MLSVLQPERRYAYSGAIPGPVGLLDPRALYLRELILIGCTFQYWRVCEASPYSNNPFG